MKYILYLFIAIFAAACVPSSNNGQKEVYKAGIRIDTILGDTILDGYRIYVRVTSGDSIKIESSEADREIYAYMKSVRFMYPRTVRDENAFTGFSEVQVDTISNFITFIICKKEHFFIENSSQVYVKLKNDSIIDFEPLARLEAFRENGIYKVHYEIPINDSIMNAIQGNISKIRFFIKGEPYDVTLEEDNISAFLNEEYGIIKNRMENKNTKEGF